ncbi:hypothetical protein [Methylotuvimicrobium sp. KM1]|uniref:hypothetical protein n=1 Tax=Methylotuvimicrobium sp. KM1 TaxID=3377707 RepID=UPI00384F1E47
MMKKITLLLGMPFLMTTGCASTIESFYNRQVVEDQMITDDTGEQEIGTLAVTAQRRLVVGNLKTGNFCSEPPPEVADSITTAIAAALKANISADKTASAELASNFARHVNQLYKRAHTVQLFRDASYHLCVNSVNSANGVNGSYESYRADITSMVTSILPYLEKEVEAYYKVEKARAENQPSVSQEIIICDSSSSLDKKSDGNENKLSTTINCHPLSRKQEDIDADSNDL